MSSDVDDGPGQADRSESAGAQRALGDSELKHRTLFETANDAILLMRQGRFVDCNARALTMYGCTREQLLDASPDGYSPPTQPDGKRSDEKALEKINLALNGEPQFFEWEHFQRDGTAFTAEVSLNRLDLGGEPLLQAIVRDVTSRKGMERALREREAQLSLILDNVSDVVFAIAVEPDGGFRFMSVNRRFLEATGLSESQIVGARVQDVIPEPARTVVIRNYEQAIRSGQPCRWEEVSEYPAGTKVGQVTVVPVFDAQGTCTQLIGMVHDITERQRAEAQVRALNEDLRRHAESLELRVSERTAELVTARDHAESADRFKSAFLATMSHELRTPLNSILGFSGILRQGLAGPLNDEQSKQMGMVCTSAEHLLALINDVLDLSKIEAGELQIASEPFDLRASVAEVIAATRPLAEKKRLALELELPAGVVPISSDRRRVEQILLNLLSNAIKFTEQGRVLVQMLPGDARVTISVTDTGMGIQDKDLVNLFKPFMQVEYGLNRRHEGTGLGLSICKKLAELLGGTIWARSEWGRGSTFAFELPMNRGER